MRPTSVRIAFKRAEGCFSIQNPSNHQSAACYPNTPAEPSPEPALWRSRDRAVAEAGRSNHQVLEVLARKTGSPPGKSDSPPRVPSGWRATPGPTRATRRSRSGCGILAILARFPGTMSIRATRPRTLAASVGVIRLARLIKGFTRGLQISQSFSSARASANTWEILAASAGVIRFASFVNVSN